MKTILELLKEFHDGAEGMANPNSKIANVFHDKMHLAYKQLRESPEGKSGIMKLMQDANPHVRCAAAAHSLYWDLNSARIVLTELRDFKGACSFEAKMVLEQFENGTLTFDF